MSIQIPLPNWLALLLIAAVGVGMLVTAAWMYVGTRGFLKGTVTTMGVVVQMDKTMDGNLLPIVRFQTASAEQVEFKSNFASSPPAYSKGEPVPVVYHPEQPEQATIKDFLSLWGAQSALASLGGGILLIAALSLLAKSSALKIKIDPDVVMALVFGLMGVGLLFAAVWMLRRTCAFLKNAVTAVGVVVDVQEIPGSSGFTQFVAGRMPALVRFHSISGADIEFVADPRSEGPAYRNGEQVTVMYDPARPGRARVEKPMQTLRVSILLGIMGFALMFFALGLLSKFIQ